MHPTSEITRKLRLATSVPGIGIRGLVSRWQQEPFICSIGPDKTKTLPQDDAFTLLSWNICGVAGGYSITDGGVAPLSDRLSLIINEIVKTNADVNCLYETFDTRLAWTICNRLQHEGYSYIYYNIGPRAVGVSSGILVASKYEIQNPEFTPFPVDSLVGRTKNATKGVFAFDLCDQNRAFARIHATHLQHSEEPQYPTAKEQSSRRQQMELIIEKVDAMKGRCAVVTGDLNLDDDEYQGSNWQSRFRKNSDYPSGVYTWGGDAFCANLVAKRASGPLNLDHTVIVEGSGDIRTTLLLTGYQANKYKKEALSDHEGLLSRITVFHPKED